MEEIENDMLCPVNLSDLRPYQFEPEANDAEQNENHFSLGNSDSEASLEDENENGNEEGNGRMDDLAWCDCENCGPMATNTECVCCHEVAPILEKVEQYNLTCITDHEGFIGNCLNRHVIEVSLYEFVDQEGPIDDNEPIHELYRHIAYRRFTRWIWHILGKGKRKVIPSCAVRKIRETFPSEEYTGFKYARP